jgi:UDP-galactopyranose mutase
MTYIARPDFLDESERVLPKTLVCFSHLRWNFVFQRPQHLLTRAAKNFDVFFVEEPVYEGAAPPHLKREKVDGVTVVVPILPEGCAPAAAVEIQSTLITEWLASTQFVAWYYTPVALAFTQKLTPALVVYDNMDELSAFKNPPPGLIEAERELLARADVVFTGGRSLFEAKKNRHDNIHCFPSSIDAAHFGAAREGLDDPSDQKEIPHPRIGFFGVVDERMDIDLVGALADARPAWQFVVLGPVVKIDPHSLPRRPNLHWLGGKRYAELPNYLAHWALGMMPFALNESTRFISPTKTPEFLAAGVPVVSTPIRDVVSDYGDLGLVEIADTPETFVAALERLLAYTPAEKTAWLASADKQLATSSWDQTWEGMHRLLESAVAGARNDYTSDTADARSTSINGNVHV